MPSTRPPAYQPDHALWPLYQPQRAPLRFTARTPPQARRWQARTRQQLARCIGFQDRCSLASPSPRSRCVEQVDRGDHRLERHELVCAPGVSMPIYLLLPTATSRIAADEQGRRPVVIAYHGHGDGVNEIVGRHPDGEERPAPAGYQQDFAIALCRLGFVVAAPEIACFGARQADFSALAARGSPVPSSCQHASKLAWHLGGTVLGMRVRDSRRLVDWLVRRPEVDPQRIGSMGISGGGMLAMFGAALDQRLRATVISGYFSSFRGSILSISHCWCNCVPGLHRFGEMHDLATLLAPRPLLIEAGRDDPIFPIREVNAGLARLRAHYRVLGAPGGVEEDLFDGGHVIHGQGAYSFLVRELADGAVSP